MSKIADSVTELVKPIVEELGMELVEVAFAKTKEGDALTVFIDKDGGVSLNDCEAVHNAIDAPLDEANVKRFAKFLREYAQNTQFILVTHRKGTMEAADVMYGVTIEDAGVSKLISVRLEDYTERG